MYINGYVPVDMSGIDLTSQSTQEKEGAYKDLQQAIKTGKPVIAVGMEWEGTPVTPINCFLVPFDGVIVGTASTLQVYVTSDDEITIRNMVPPEFD